MRLKELSILLLIVCKVICCYNVAIFVDGGEPGIKERFCSTSENDLFDIILVSSIDPCHTERALGNLKSKHFSPPILLSLDGLLLFSRLTIEEIRIEYLVQNVGFNHGLDILLNFLRTIKFCILNSGVSQITSTVLGKIIEVLPSKLKPTVLHLEEIEPVDSDGLIQLMQDWMINSNGFDAVASKEIFSEQTDVLPFPRTASLLHVIATQYATVKAARNNSAGNCSNHMTAKDQSIFDKIAVGRSIAKNHITSNNNKYSYKQLNPKILCMTYTTSTNQQAVRDIVDTWGRQCDGYLAWSNWTDYSASTIEVRVNDNNFGGNNNKVWAENYHHMWTKTQYIWKTVYSALSEEFDYFLLGGDDVYVIVDNLRALLRSPLVLNASEANAYANANAASNPLLIGRKLNQNAYLSFVSGGPGYLLNRAALKRLVWSLSEMPSECLSTIVTSMEDLMVSHCLWLTGVEPLDIGNWELTSLDDDIPEDAKSESRNGVAEEYFHPLSPTESWNANKDWYTRMADRFEVGEHCCSAHSIAFHDIKPPMHHMRCVHSALNPSIGD